MAIAKRVEPARKPLVDTRDVQLTLTYEEAEALRTLLYCNVSGKGRTRNLINAIGDSLKDVGVSSANHAFNGCAEALKGVNESV